MKPVEVAYFQQNIAFGATEHYLYDLAENVDRKKFRVHLICPDSPMLDAFENLKAHDVIVHRYPERFCSGSAAKGIYGLRELFRCIKPTIVHFNDICIRGLLASRIARVPVSVMTHHTPELNRQYSRLGRLAERLAFLSASYVIIPCEPSRELSIRKDGVSPNHSQAIPYGLRPDWFHPAENSRTNIRQALNIPDGHTVVLTAGRLCAQKRPDIFVEAARHVLKKTVHVTFLLAGEGELRSQLEQVITAADIKNNCRLLGHRQDMRDLMSACDIFVMCSDFEGICYAALEASARGLAIIASNVGGLRFSVVEGETGLLVPPSDPVALAAALDGLIANPAQIRKLGESGNRRARLLFTLNRMVEETQSCYLSLLQQCKITC